MMCVNLQDYFTPQIMVSIHFGNHILNFGIKIVSYLGGQCIYIGLLNNKTVLIWCHFLDHNCKKKKKKTVARP